MSDEITCSECGRPNLPEAEKCWYCQTSLRTHEENPETETGEHLDLSANGQASAEMLNDEKADEDIPEWLKRIRELKKADQPEEEEEDQWRQQILFDSGQNEPSKKKPSRASTPRPVSKSDPDKSSPQSAVEDEPPQNQEAQPLPDPILEQKETDDDPEAIDPGDEELPDGFTPLDTKKG